MAPQSWQRRWEKLCKGSAFPIEQIPVGGLGPDLTFLYSFGILALAKSLRKQEAPAQNFVTPNRRDAENW